MYSQGEEDETILTYFKDFKGRLLEIGAYHPTVFSNSRALIEKGWEAVLVEPSPKCYPAIEEFYKDNDRVSTVQVAIGPEEGMLKFYDSAGGVATALEEHYNVWKKQQLDYEVVDVPCVTWEKFYSTFPGVYDFISIDTEGMDWSILQQIDFEKTQTKLLCMEASYDRNDIINFFMKYRFRLLHMTENNLIVVR